MLTPEAVCQQITAMVSFLVEVGLSSDQQFAFVRSHSATNKEVTFDGAEHVSVALKDRSYGQIYSHLNATRAFIVKFPDGALLLMRYNFNEGVLFQHSLGFYPSPTLEEFQNNPEIYIEDVVFADVISRNIVPFPIRFDYDCRPDVARPVLHPKSHLTLGQYKNCRIPVTSPLTPVSFTTFILRHFYNTAFSQYSNKVPRFTAYFDEAIHDEEKLIIHVAIPRVV